MMHILLYPASCILYQIFYLLRQRIADIPSEQGPASPSPQHQVDERRRGGLPVRPGDREELRSLSLQYAVSEFEFADDLDSRPLCLHERLDGQRDSRTY